MDSGWAEQEMLLNVPANRARVAAQTIESGREQLPRFYLSKTARTPVYAAGRWHWAPLSERSFDNATSSYAVSKTEHDGEQDTIPLQAPPLIRGDMTPSRNEHLVEPGANPGFRPTAHNEMHECNDFKS